MLANNANLTIQSGASAAFANSPTLGTVTSQGALSFSSVAVAVTVLNGTSGSLSLVGSTILTIQSGTYAAR